ncbi:MAG: hypothetical protein WDZ64_00650 [Parcubacteria group bacterium]
MITLKKFTLAIIALIILIGIYMVLPKSAAISPEPEEVFCTADAMQCPDGTWVGRTGPDCEFVCPAE